MKKHALLIATAIVILAAFAYDRGSAQEEKEIIKIAEKAGIGKYLISSDGRALYYFKKDSPGKSECSGQCAEKWPVYCYRADQISATDGLKQSDFSSFHRQIDDRAHLTYKGMPLYNYIGDKNPGDTNGHGINSLWFVVKP